MAKEIAEKHEEKKEAQAPSEVVSDVTTDVTDTQAQPDNQESTSTPATAKKKKKWKAQVLRGRANVLCTYNNTIVSLADMSGATLAWSSSGHLGFKGAKKSTPYAATQVVGEVVEKVKKYGLQEVDVFVRGVGSGREAAIRALSNNGLTLLSIKDTTPVPHGGCRPPRPRRV